MEPGRLTFFDQAGMDMTHIVNYTSAVRLLNATLDRNIWRSNQTQNAKSYGVIWNTPMEFW